MSIAVVDQPVRGVVPGLGFASLPGIERMRALIDGRVPPSPVQHLTGLRLVQVGHGSAVAAMPASPWFQTQAGFFLSGVTALAADLALGGAIASVLPAWTAPVTSEINFTYLRPVRVDAGKLIARARLIDAGRNQGTSEALVEDGDGRLLAHATTRCFVRAIDPVPESFEPIEAPAYDTPDPFELPIPADVAPRAPLADLSGAEVLERISSGALPAPFSHLTGLFLNFDVTQGAVVAPFPATPWFTSPSGTVYGGLLCWVADMLTTAAATSILEPRTGTASLDLKVHFLRPVLADGAMLRGSGEVVHGGRGLIVSTARIASAEGKPVIIASGSFMRRAIRDWVQVVGR